MFIDTNMVFKRDAINYWTQKTIEVIYCLGFLWLVVYLLFYYVFSFNYELNLIDQYVLVFWIPFFVLILISTYKYKTDSAQELAVGLLIVLLIMGLLHFSSYYSFSNEYFFTLSTIASACYGVFLLKQLKFIEILIVLFVGLFLVQLFLGLHQRFILGINNGLLISGSLENSGVYTYFLVFNLPFFHWFCFSNYFFKQEFANFALKSLFVLVLAMVLYFIYFTQSRTAFVCLSITVGYFLLINYKRELMIYVKHSSRFTLSIIGITSIGSVLWLSIWLFNIKRMSAIGRMLNIEIAWQHILDHFWVGTGIGRFTWYYPQWQATYFNLQSNPKLTYFFSAAESYIIFNEYLQLFQTIGLIGFLLCGYGVYRFFKLRSMNYGSLLLATKCTVLAILTSGFTSYPLHINFVLLLLGTCLAAGFVLADIGKFKSTKSLLIVPNKVLLISCLFLTCGVLYKGYFLYGAATEWATLRNNRSFNHLGNYKKIYPLLNNDGKFLADYGGALLADSNQVILAMHILEKAKGYLITRKTIESLTAAYRSVRKYDSAIETQLFLVNYLPNKFLPRYNLMQLYIMQNDTLNIKKTGKMILFMPVKIPSFEVNNIKKDTRNILKMYP